MPRTARALGALFMGALLMSCSTGTVTSPVPVAAGTSSEGLDAGKPALGSWGVEIDNFSKTVSPGDDFFTYVNERWLQTASRPPGYSRFMEMNAMHLRTEARIKEIIEQPGEEAGATGGQKIQDLYQSFTNVAAAVVRHVDATRIHCPCQPGSVDLARGRRCGGPPRRPLARILLEVRGGAIYATGVDWRTV